MRRAESGERGAAAALALMDDPVRLIGTVQVGITALGILLGAVAEPAVRAIVGDGAPSWLAFALGVVVTTYLGVAFGELVPKALALHDPEPIAIRVARLVTLLGRASAPAVWILQRSAAVVLRPLGIPGVTAGERPVSRDELLSIVADAEEAGALDPEEESLIAAAVRLRGRTVADVMVPWSGVATIDPELPFDDVVAAVARGPHTRMPVVGPGDAVRGVLHARDLWRAAVDGERSISGLVRPPMAFPPSAAARAVLRELRDRRTHLAIVLDEYGRPLGIVTLEDLLEELVGEIDDELDPPSAAGARASGDGPVRIAAATSLVDVRRTTGLVVDRAADVRARTIGGLLQELLDRVPVAGDSVVAGDVRITAVEVDGARPVTVELARVGPSGSA